LPLCVIVTYEKRERADVERFAARLLLLTWLGERMTPPPGATARRARGAKSASATSVSAARYATVRKNHR
jgi:hypothetical protein